MSFVLLLSISFAHNVHAFCANYFVWNIPLILSVDRRQDIRKTCSEETFVHHIRRNIIPATSGPNGIGTFPLVEIRQFLAHSDPFVSIFIPTSQRETHSYHARDLSARHSFVLIYSSLCLARDEANNTRSGWRNWDQAEGGGNMEPLPRSRHERTCKTDWVAGAGARRLANHSSRHVQWVVGMCITCFQAKKNCLIAVIRSDKSESIWTGQIRICRWI